MDTTYTKDSTLSWDDEVPSCSNDNQVSSSCSNRVFEEDDDYIKNKRKVLLSPLIETFDEDDENIVGLANIKNNDQAFENNKKVDNLSPETLRRSDDPHNVNQIADSPLSRKSISKIDDILNQNSDGEDTENDISQCINISTDSDAMFDDDESPSAELINTVYYSSDEDKSPESMILKHRDVNFPIKKELNFVENLENVSASLVEVESKRNAGSNLDMSLLLLKIVVLLLCLYSLFLLLTSLASK